MDQKLLDLLLENGIAFREQVPMAEYTTFRTGGPADLVVFPSDESQLAFCLGVFSEGFLLLGNCSNVLVSDLGIADPVILLGKNFSNITVEHRCFTAQAGARLSSLCNSALEAGLTGLEFASGIPGTVGGGIYMNAGAYGGELSQFVQSVRAMDVQGNILQLAPQALAMGYRHSIFMEQNLVILSASFILEQGDVEAARQHVRELNAARRCKQPLEYPSAGSTFKRPAGHYAGALIEQSGLKGFSIGGAQVSEKHAGFIINTGKATTDDIRALITHIQNCVLHNSGILLEPEIRLIGRA